MSLSLQLLTRQTPWYGKHSGYYERLPEYLAGELDAVSVIAPRRTVLNRAIGKLYSLARGWPSRDQSLTAAELRFLRGVRRIPARVNHILGIEDHLPFISHWEKAPRSVIGTIHFPRSHWTGNSLDRLRALSSAIVLYQKDIPFFEAVIGEGRVRFIHHGVDLSFFSPLTNLPEANERILFVGQFGRNFAMLARLMERLLAERPAARFDLAIAAHAQNTPALAAFREHPRVSWHAKISDEQLRTLYREAAVLLLPMQESGANNSVVEALACGLPIVTTDVGGIRDYGGGAIFPVVPNDDDGAMYFEVCQLLDTPVRRTGIARAEREFVVAQLGWEKIARAHLCAYSELAVAPRAFESASRDPVQLTTA